MRRACPRARLQREARGLNLLLPGHEDEDVAGRVAQVHRQRLLHRRLHIVLLRARPPAAGTVAAPARPGPPGQ